MSARQERSALHATFTIERTYEAKPAHVFKAWAEPAAKASWFGPKSLPRESREFAFEVGGHERFAIETPDGSVYRFDSRYQDIVEDERIVYAYDMYLDEARISVSLATSRVRGSRHRDEAALHRAGGLSRRSRHTRRA
jgi:uncharacterized protein YndB with AHSA1/START domain